MHYFILFVLFCSVNSPHYYSLFLVKRFHPSVQHNKKKRTEDILTQKKTNRHTNSVPFPENIKLRGYKTPSIMRWNIQLPSRLYF